MGLYQIVKGLFVPPPRGESMIKMAAQQPCKECPGKKQNCGAFGTYLSDKSEDTAKAMCHGGLYCNEMYVKCPVQDECRAVTEKARLPIAPTAAASRGPAADVVSAALRQAAEAVQAVTLPSFRVGNFGMPTETQMPRAQEPQPATAPRPTVVGQVLNAAAQQVKSAMPSTPELSAQVRANGQFPSAYVPLKDALPAMRSAFAAPHPSNGELSPTFLPNEGESTWSRLLKNILQGMLAALGWVLWNYARTIDLFGA
jgi:hypothetical protein